MYELNGKVRSRWSITGVDTNGGGVTATKAASADAARAHCLHGIQCSGDAAALVTVESPASTVIWRKRFAAAFNFSETFPTGLQGAAGEAIHIVISAGTTNTEANGQGVTV